jgi:Putative zinc-finger
MQHSIEISCEHVWREVSNFLDHEIDAELRTRMEAHFKVCAHCAAVLDGARNLVAIVGDGRAFELPNGFSERLRERIAKQLSSEQDPPKNS